MNALSETTIQREYVKPCKSLAMLPTM